MKLILPAPAKLNLCLKILGRRADGYHNLQSIMLPIYSKHLCDKLTFIPRSDGQIKLHANIADLDYQDNLIWRSAVALKDKVANSLGVDIFLEKKIPMGAGLGGGSSDAATTLFGLNYLWQCNLSLQELAEIGLQLGADIPFFVYGDQALVEGIGERITPISCSRQNWFVVIVPDAYVQTAAIFQAKQLTRNSKPCKLHALLDDKQNDCMATVMQLYPQVRDTIIQLDKYAAARLTGTGSCVFAQVDSLDEAKELVSKISFARAFIAKGCNKSVLHVFLQRLARLQKC